MVPSTENVNTIPQNQNTSATPTTEQPQINVDIPGLSQQRPTVPPTFIDENPMGGIRDEDRLVCEEQEKLNAEPAHAEEEVRA
ncbi:hypothetical protein LIER_37993 [Lithospermum erythrorhizon]|uniref:Uncharacterized protein n=1 Tax=Lithospermum erythrorhizon TaxID=34254 RepID=A0AAV3PV08_LITER